MYVCVYVNVCVPVLICEWFNLCVCVFVCVPTCMYAYLCDCVSPSMSQYVPCISVCVHLRVCVNEGGRL